MYQLKSYVGAIVIKEMRITVNCVNIPIAIEYPDSDGIKNARQ